MLGVHARTENGARPPHPGRGADRVDAGLDDTRQQAVPAGVHHGDRVGVAERDRRAVGSQDGERESARRRDGRVRLGRPRRPAPSAT